jgi:signal transduction histidine kinase
MVAAAKQLDDVLEEVFTYSESLHPVMDQWDLNQLAATVADAIRPKLDELQLLLELDLTEGMPKAWLDYKQISFCLRAIILHVAARQQQGGVIRLESSAGGSTLRLCVLDSRNSLSADDRSGLMTPFSETETLGEGGGLALCKVILERHGSMLAMEDIAGGGTKYCITLQEKGVI